MCMHTPPGNLPAVLSSRGWGLRCLDDVPSGGFLCIYAGQLLSEEGADQVPLSQALDSVYPSC